ncbi:hypothetical protein JCM8208_004402 [Rhodotorula glutinis]
MSDRLDDDVLLLILDHLAMPSTDCDVYLASKKVLYNVCLGSSRLRRLAQPLLWRHIWVSDAGPVAALEHVPVESSIGRHTVSFKLGSTKYGGPPQRYAVEVIRFGPGRILRILRREPVHIDIVGSFSNLRKLSLNDVDLDNSSLTVQLPHLDQLHIYDARAFTATGALDWLRPCGLPALRILSITAVTQAHTSLIQLDKVLDADLLAQLDVLQTDVAMVHPDSTIALGTAPPVLFFDPPDHKPTIPRHSVHPMQKATDVAGVSDIVFDVADQVESTMASCAALGPRVVVFPRRVLKLSAQHKDVGDAVRRLEQACGRAVRILWSDEDDMDFTSGGVSREFVRYARELKAAQAADGLGA